MESTYLSRVAQYDAVRFDTEVIEIFKRQLAEATKHVSSVPISKMCSASSSDDENVLLLALALDLDKASKKKKRYQLSEFVQLHKELSFSDETFQEYFVLNHTEFEEVLGFVGPRITKLTTSLRKPIGPRQRLGIFLRFLVTGDSFNNISSDYDIGTATTSKIMEEVSEALWLALKPVVMPDPTERDWHRIAAEYKQKFGVPNCIGTIGGRKIDTIFEKRSRHDISDKTRIALVGVCDARSRFVIIDVSVYDAMDGIVFTKSDLCRNIEDGRIALPKPEAFDSGSDSDFMRTKQPFVFFGDEVFPLKNYLLRPYPRTKIGLQRGKLFNEKLNKMREIVDNALQMVATKFRVFQKPLGSKPETILNLVRAACCLYNYKLTNQTIDEMIENCKGELWKLKLLCKVGGNRGYASINTREVFAEYLKSQETFDGWIAGHFLDSDKKM